MRKWVADPAYKVAVDLIIAARKEAGLTQRAVEDRLGERHHGYLAKIELRERQMNVIEFVQIARAIGADEKALLEELLRRSEPSDAEG